MNVTEKMTRLNQTNRTYMIRIFKNLLVSGLLFAVVTVALRAAETKTVPLAETKPVLSSKPATATTLTGHIVFIDKSLHAMAVDVKGKLLQINLVSRLRISKGGQLVSIEELAAGQEVTITFRETLQGRLDVVSVSVGGSPNQAESATGLKPAPQSALRDRDHDRDNRFSSDLNPANVGGHIRSPNH